MTGWPENRLWASGVWHTWADLDGSPLPDKAVVLSDRQLPALQAVWTAVRRGSELLVTSPARVDDASVRDLRDEGFTILSDDEGASEPTSVGAATHGRLWLTTSGSTGRPKRVAHTLESLTTVTSAQPPRVWLLPYSPGTYAWWQLVTLALAHPRQSLVAIDGAGIDSWPAVAAETGVDAISATPTFWRQALWRSAADVEALSLAQVTLGGEPVDQDLLDQLRERFPDARVSWIYASSEAGAAIAVHDGRAGFPARWLERSIEGRPRLHIRDDELVLESPHRAVGLDAVIRTGDRVEVRDERVHIVGRLGSDEINVGGSKISAATVRHTLLSHPAVAWAQVRGRKAPIVGTLVQAEVVLSDPVPEADLTRWCAERLPEYGVPRRFRVLKEIPMKGTLKSDV